MVTIQCPDSGQNIVVTTQGSGSGATATMCAFGTVGDGLVGQDYTLIVLVRVLSGFGVASPGPLTYQPGDCKAKVDVSSNWCGRPVNVPAPVQDGAAFTIFAWIPADPGDPEPVPDIKSFFANGSNPRDCCAEGTCGSGSGSGMMGASFTAELAAAPELLVTVSSGRHAGEYRATAVASLQWNVTIGGAPYTLVCVEGTSMTFHGPSESAPSLSFDSDPFSATFPGDLLDAADEIVVIVA